MCVDALRGLASHHPWRLLDPGPSALAIFTNANLEAGFLLFMAHGGAPLEPKLRWVHSLYPRRVV